MDEYVLMGNEIQTILRATIDGFCLVDLEGNILDTNDSYCSMLGYSREELLKLKVKDIEKVDSEEAINQRIRTGLETGYARFETKHLRKDGRVIDVEASVKYSGGGQPRFYCFIRDITEQKKASKALSEEVEHRRGLFELAPVGIVIIEPETGRFLEFNHAAHQQLGYSHEEFSKLSISDVEALESNTETRSRIESLMRGAKLDFVTRHRTKQGEIRDVQITAQVMKIAGNIVLQGVWQDVTQRKLTEELLRESEKKYRVLVDNANEAIVVAQDGKLKFVNRMAFEILPGYSQEDFLNTPFIDFFHPDDRALAANTFKERLLGVSQEQRNQYRLIMRDGTVKWVMVGSALIDWEGKPATLSFISDITREKKAEEILIESEYRFRTLIERAPIAISVSREGQFLYANQKLRQLLGVQTQEEMIGRSVTEYFAPQSREESHERIRRRSSGLDTPSEFESVGLRADGTQYHSLIQVSQVQLADGLANIAFITDITERKRTETESQRLREKAEISSRLAAVGELAAGIAHEINNPLTGVIGFSELLLEENLPPDIKNQIKVIADGSLRVKDIVKRMLTIARQNKFVKTSANINKLMESTLDLRSYILRTSNIEVVKHFDLNIPEIFVDSGQIQQVFLNLIVNAEHSMKKAHGRGKLTVTTEKVASEIRISIEDDGAGISREAQGKLFNPFFSTKEVNEGTGLGLSLSRSIVIEHDGTIEVESEIGKGARFIVTLPVTVSMETAEIGTANRKKPSPKIKEARILVVDDEEPIRKLLSAVLEKKGQTVETTADAEEALVKMDINSYDAVLIDIRMPGMSGIELYNIVKAKRPELAGRFIFITGDISDENTKAFLEKNELSFISKPFDREALDQKVKDLL